MKKFRNCGAINLQEANIVSGLTVDDRNIPARCTEDQKDSAVLIRLQTLHMCVHACVCIYTLTFQYSTSFRLML